MGFDLVWGSREGLRLDRRKAIAFNAQRVSKILALHLIERGKERVVFSCIRDVCGAKAKFSAFRCVFGNYFEWL